jgi:hypothetical protein
MLIDMKHLKEKQHYIDLYDTFTVDKCRKAERYHEDLDDSIFEKAKEKPTAYDIARVKYVTKEMHVHFTAGEEYRNKSETIRQWMERDIQLDARVESAEEPQLIRCKTCTSKMTCTSRDIWGLENKVQFFFECPNKCLPHRVIYGDGSEFKSKPVLCEKCDNEMSRNSERLQEQIVTTTYYCSGCTHTYTNELDLSPKEEVVDPDFEKDRERFCLTEEKGSRYIQDCINIQQLGDMMKKTKEREEKKEIYDEVKALQKLTIPQLKTYLVELFENETYSNLIFEKPDMGRIVSVEFNVEEMETDNERVSMLKLKKLLQKHLEKTNWRLMSDGVSYRLGILSGRIRIYEDQDDLAKLIEKKK